MKKFLTLTKIEGREIMLAPDSIASIEVCDEESTWVEMTTGAKFLVREFACEILEALGTESIDVPHHDDAGQ